MEIVFMMLVSAAMVMAGLMMILQHENKGIGIFLLTTGTILLIMPMSGVVEDGGGGLIFLGSYYFLIPAWSAYRTYHAPYDSEDVDEKIRKAAYARMWLFVALYILGIIIGLAIICTALAI